MANINYEHYKLPHILYFQQLSYDIYLIPLLVKWCGIKTARMEMVLFVFCFLTFVCLVLFPHIRDVLACVYVHTHVGFPCVYKCTCIWVGMPVHTWSSCWESSAVPTLLIEKGSLFWNQSSLFWLIKFVNVIQGPLSLSSPMRELEADCNAQQYLHG